MIQNNDYGQGMLDATDQIILFVEKEIEKTKSDSPEKNSPRQITNGGKLLAFNKVLAKLKSKREKINEKL